MSSVFSSLFIEMSESISFKSKLNSAWVLSVFGVVAVLSKTEQNLKTTEKNLVVFLTFILNWLHVGRNTLWVQKKFSFDEKIEIVASNINVNEVTYSVSNCEYLPK